MAHLAEALDRLRADNSGRYRRGRAFEKLVRNALLANPQYQDRFTNLWLWSEWPQAGGVDLGIDLVGEQAEDYGGGLCAIQCKFYRGGSVSIGEVNKFLSYTLDDRWTARIFVATGNYSANSRKKLNEAACEIITAGDLDIWPVGDWRDLIEKPDTLRWAADRHVPRTHQEAALEAIRAGLFDSSTGDRLGRVLMPCGSGKSETALWAAERNVGWAGRVLYLVPSIALMGQTMRTWAYQRDPEMQHRYVAVCSDVKAGRDTEDADLSELAMPVTTKADEIAWKLKREAPEAMTVVFSTYQSLPVVCESQKLGAPPFDLVICDEAHRTTGVEKGRGSTQSPFQMVHDRKRLRADRRLFMTATQRIYTTASRSRAGGEVFSMDDEDRYGPILYQQSFRDAIDAGLLSDYEVVVIAYGESHQIGSYDKYRKDYQDTHGDEPKTRRLNAEDWVQLVGCWDALADPTSTGTDRDKPAGALNPFYGCRRAIAFTNKIVNSKKVEKHWRPVCESYLDERRGEYRGIDVATLDVEHIDGKQNAFERAQKVQWLRGEDQPDQTTRVLTNARCLSEGVDIPALDAVLFLAPRQSEVDIVQAVGRVMRRAEGKDKGYIVIPVLVPDDQTLHSEEFLRGSAFQQVWKVCRALRAHDERFDALVNAPGLAGSIPMRVIDRTCPVQETLELEELPGLLPRIASVLVEQVGDRHYWPSWGQNAAGVYRKVRSELDRTTSAGPNRTALERFTDHMRETVMPAFGRQDALEMIAQHAVTIPVFDAFFADHAFRDLNPVSRHLNSVLDELGAGGISLEQLVAPLERSYRRIKDVFRDVSEDTDPTTSKLQILQDVYEGFFKAAIPEVVSRLGIVYTPMPLVDFMLRSADAVCRKHFGKALSDPDVEILDPFTGTGTFISRLLEISDATGRPLIADTDVARKYRTELHANDLVLLAYYIAALKIEQAAASRGAFEDGYRPFQGIVLRDTFSGVTAGRLDMDDQNPERAQEQDRRTIRVIIANPPWSAGQKSAGDDNPNLQNIHIADRVRDTYGRRHKQVTGRAPGGNSGGNLYVQAFRWASDRIGDPGSGERHGVVVFVHPNSLATGTALAGMRAALRDEFDHLYVVNLRGDAYKSGEEFRREGDKLFGGGSRNAVQITVAVRQPGPARDRPGRLHYAEVPEYSTLEQKFAWLSQLGDVTSPAFEEVPLNQRHDWVNLTDGTFDDLLPVCRTARDASHEVAVRASAAGVKTNCDAYVYSFSRSDLIKRISRLIDAYNDALELLELGEPLDEVTANYELDRIKWTAALRQSLRGRTQIVFDESRIRQVLYRPFTKLWLYEDDRILSSVKTVSAMFPRGDSRAIPPPPANWGLLISTPSNSSIFSLLASDRVGDLKSAGMAAACRYIPRRGQS